MPLAPGTGVRQFNVYNPGTECCGLSLKLSGRVSNPVMFLNETNGTQCIIRSLPTNNLILSVDGDTGMCMVLYNILATTGEPAFAYHDRGFIRLETELNNIRIMEQNASGNWQAPSTLVLNTINIDYKPRIL